MLFADPARELKDCLNGAGRPARFAIKAEKAVQSGAEWKRCDLSECHFATHEGLYADAKAICRAILEKQRGFAGEISLEERGLPRISPSLISKAPPALAERTPEKRLEKRIPLS